MTGSGAEQAKYHVYVDSNAHYMDESERYSGGVYEDRDVAIAKCRQIVDDFLLDEYTEGMRPQELLKRYQAFGEDPWISSGDESCKFSARDYAQERCREICLPRRDSDYQ